MTKATKFKLIPTSNKVQKIEENMKQQPPLFFIHIPKTAGTSFRVAMESSFGEESVIADYGPKSLETHKVVKKFSYQLDSRYDVLAYLEKLESTTVALTGHVSFARYVGLFPSCQIMTFIRQPLERLRSEYKHRVRLQAYEKSFGDFIQEPSSINLQMRYLAGANLSSLGFIGLTEDYEFSVSMINEAYSIKLPNFLLNTAPSNNTEEPVSEEDLLLFNLLNKRDICLYAQLVKMYEARKQFFCQNLTFTYGEFFLNDDSSISGFAFQKNSNSAVELVVEIRGKEIVEVEAKYFRDDLNKFGVPRRGYVGFNLKLRKKAQSQDEIGVRVKATGQYLQHKIIC